MGRAEKNSAEFDSSNVRFPTNFLFNLKLSVNLSKKNIRRNDKVLIILFLYMYILLIEQNRLHFGKFYIYVLIFKTLPNQATSSDKQTALKREIGHETH